MVNSYRLFRQKEIHTSLKRGLFKHKICIPAYNSCYIFFQHSSLLMLTWDHHYFCFVFTKRKKKNNNGLIKKVRSRSRDTQPPSCPRLHTLLSYCHNHARPFLSILLVRSDLLTVSGLQTKNYIPPTHPYALLLLWVSSFPIHHEMLTLSENVPELLT